MSDRLLVVVVKGHRRLEELLEGFLELALPGATVIDARGMGQVVSADIPVFSGFRSLFGGGTEESYLVLSVIAEAEIAEALALVRDVCGDFSKTGGGIVFTVPAHDFTGYRPPEGNESD